MDDPREAAETQIKMARERTDLAIERNRLANERTFLAWLRTGLASVGGGIAVIRLLTFNNVVHQRTSQLVGSLLVLLGVAIFLFSYADYRNSFKRLKITSISNRYIGVMLIISLMLSVLSILLLYIVFN